MLYEVGGWCFLFFKYLAKRFFELYIELYVFSAALHSFLNICHKRCMQIQKIQKIRAMQQLGLDPRH